MRLLRALAVSCGIALVVAGCSSGSGGTVPGFDNGDAGAGKDGAKAGGDLPDGKDGGRQPEGDPFEREDGGDSGADPGADHGGGGDFTIPQPSELCLVGYSEYCILTYNNGYEKHREYLDLLASRGLNLVRVWIFGYGNWEREDGENCGESWFELMPFRRSGRGGKYDLTDFNPDFFTRLRDFLSYAESKGIFTELTFFDSWGLKHVGEWSFNPWDSDYNVNGVMTQRGQCDVLGAFFDPANAALADIQKGIVRKVVRETAGFRRIIYETMNEPFLCRDLHAQTAEWNRRVIGWVREVRPEALISVNDGVGREDNSCGSAFAEAGDTLGFPEYQIVTPHWGAWGDESSEVCITEMVNFLAPYGKHVIADDDGCSVKKDGQKIRRLPENLRLWAGEATAAGASFNHLQDDLYCTYFHLPAADMLDALGSALASCH